MIKYSWPNSVVTENVTEIAHQTRFRDNWMSDCGPPRHNRGTALKSEVSGLSTVNIPECLIYYMFMIVDQM